MDKNVIILKRDGTKESFSYDKLVASIARAGVPIANSEIIALDVSKWIAGNLENGEIKSTTVRDEITLELMSDFPVQADNYQVFKKS